MCHSQLRIKRTEASFYNLSRGKRLRSINTKMSAANGNPSQQNNKHLSFVDESWLHAFGLSEENALDYFAISMFYDYRSNNQAIRTQGASVSQLRNMTGLEYGLEVSQQVPPVYVVKKQNRTSPRNVNVLEVYYIINGVIYQSPSLMDVVSTRLAKTALYLNRALGVMTSEHSYSNAEGHVTFKPNAEGAAETSEVVKRELVSRELPSMQSTIDDIKSFCESTQ